jgi:hypothetical protein
MVLAAHSDASFHSESKLRSRAGGHIFLSEDDPIPRNNGPLLSISRVMKHVCPSAAEAETGALFIVAQEMVPLRNMLTEMGWPHHDHHYKRTNPQPMVTSTTQSL